MSLQSSWSTCFRSPSHITSLEKLQRVGGFEALELEHERYEYEGAKVQRSTFLATHAATTWPELIVEMMNVARNICSEWRMDLRRGFIAGRTGEGQTGRPVKPSGAMDIRWEINEQQLYKRLMLLSGGPNRW